MACVAHVFVWRDIPCVEHVKEHTSITTFDSFEADARTGNQMHSITNSHISDTPYTVGLNAGKNVREMIQHCNVMFKQKAAPFVYSLCISNFCWPHSIFSRIFGYPRLII